MDKKRQPLPVNMVVRKYTRSKASSSLGGVTKAKDLFCNQWQSPGLKNQCCKPRYAGVVRVRRNSKVLQEGSPGCRHTKQQQQVMYNSTITYTSQVGAHISQLFTGYPTDDKALLKAKAWVNETIMRFRYKPATSQNCQNLLAYIREKMGEMYRRPWSKARNELIRQCENRINILQEVIREQEEQVVELRDKIVAQIRTEMSKAM